MTACPCACHTGGERCDRFAELGGCHDRARPHTTPSAARDDGPRPGPAPGPSYRCRRDWRCAGRTQVRDDVTGELTGWDAALPAGGRPDGLCITCEGRTDAALVALPRLALDLDAMIGRDATATPPSSAPSSGSKERPIPVRTDVEAVRAWLEHVAEQWAARVGNALDDDEVWELGAVPWSATPTGWRSRREDHLAWLRAYTGTLLALPAAPMPVWSAGEHPADGHHAPHDDVTVGPGRDGPGQLFWTDQDGVDGAIALIELQRAAERVTGAATPRETTSVGCTRCGWPTMHRDAGAPEFRCPRCRWTRPEADHDVLLAHLLGSRPETGPTQRARQRKERHDSAARAARLAAGRGRHR